MNVWEMKTREPLSGLFCASNISRKQNVTRCEERVIEARARPRQQIYGNCEYRYPSDSDYRNCFLVNLSQVGAFIIVDNKLPIESFINVKIESDNADEPPIAFLATIVREEIQPGGKQFGYGCEILEIDDGMDDGD